MGGLNTYKYENDISGIADLHDTTSYALIASVGLETAGAASTANAIVNIGRYAESTVYINSTNGPATNAGTTGLTIIFDTRPASAIAWFTFRTETGVQTTGLSAFRIVGSGVAGLSGVAHFEDVRVTIQNTTDSSGTATVQAWMQSRTP